MNFDYDVIIIGAGPVGSTLAYELANENLDVCLIDKKKEIGLPLQCAGIVSKNIINYNEVPEDVILNKAKGAYLHSPNHCLKVVKDEPEALVLDRVAYDQFLFKRAIKNGVDIFKQSKVVAIDYKKGVVSYDSCSEIKTLKSKVIVGADGSNSFVSKELANEFNFYNASQFLVKISEKNQDFDFVDIYAKEELFPGFIWIIPVYKDIFRIGLFSKDNFKKQTDILNKFLRDDFKFDNYEVLETYHGKIPIFDKNTILVKDRAILIGDAASQLKPTTGGGLILGFDSVKIAKTAIVKSILKKDISFLNDYQKNFMDKYSKELSYQIKVQKTLCTLSNDDLDYFFVKLKEKGAEKIISKYGDMDKQSILVKEFIKKGFLFSLLPSFIGRKVSKIWSSN